MADLDLICGTMPARRHTPENLAEWRTIPTSIISDELQRGQTLAAAIRPLRQDVAFAAEAMTVRVMVGDNGPIHYAASIAEPDTAMLVDARGHEDTAVSGAIITAAAQARGVVAMVIDGAVRDAADLRKAKTIVYSRAVVPNGPHKGFGGAINLPIQCAGVAVSPGDLVVGDDDGVIVIRPEQEEGLMARCRKRLEKEAEHLDRIQQGATTVEILGFPPLSEIAKKV